MRDLIERDVRILNFLDCDYSFVNQPLNEPIVEKIVAELPKHKHGLRALIEAVVTSDLFLTR